jgi:protein ImuB
MKPDASGGPSPRRYLALCLPCLPTDRVRRRERADDGLPLALTAPVRGALRLVAVDARAAALGLRAGHALADARALQPSLRVLEADPAAEARLITQIADWARRYTPLTAVDGADGVVLDIAGCAHLFGGEAALAADMARRLAAQGFTTPRIAIAGTPEAAWALARFAPPARRLCPPGGEETALRPLPVAALGLAREVVADLDVAGLTRIEDLWLRPRAPVAARFGRHVTARLEAMFGLSRSAITPRLEAPPYVAERRFLDPVMTLDSVKHAVARLCGEIAGMLTRHGEGARRLQVMLFRVDGASFRIEAGLSRPSRTAEALAGLFAERLAVGPDERDVGFGFDVVRLAVTEAARLDEDAPRLDAEPGAEDMARLVDRLSARLGPEAVRRLEPVNAHAPEAAGRAPPLAAAGAGGAPSPRTARAWNPTRAAGEAPDRPLLLLERPEAVETIAAVPDGPPLRFRWRRALHDVTASEGPERISLPWWGARQAPTRDYFRAEDRQGRRFWLYREGLYGRETGQPRWFVHGLFA